VDRVKAAAARILPMGYSLKMIGQAEEFAKTAAYMQFTFIMAILLVYMVLRAPPPRVLSWPPA
jgi:HAE1 family hydrophobic/amphiphilic exporter-1